MRPDEESLCADARKLPLKGRNAGVPKTVFGVQEMAARGSPAAHQLGNAGGSAIGRAILFHSAQGHGQPLAHSSLGCDFGRGSSRSEARAEAGATCAPRGCAKAIEQRTHKSRRRRARLRPTAVPQRHTRINCAPHQASATISLSAASRAIARPVRPTRIRISPAPSGLLSTVPTVPSTRPQSVR